MARAGAPDFVFSSAASRASFMAQGLRCAPRWGVPCRILCVVSAHVRQRVQGRRVSGSGAMAASGPLCRQAWPPKHLSYGFWLCADCSVTSSAGRATPGHFMIIALRRPRPGF